MGDRLSLRVATGPTNPAGTAGALAAGLRAVGADAEVVVWSEHPFGYPVDRVLGGTRRALYAARAPLRRDVLHYHYGSTWTLRFADAYWARVWGRTLVATYHGDDCRLYGVARRVFPSRGRTGDPARDPWVRRRVRRLARACHAALVADLELATYVAPFYRRVYVTPLAVGSSAVPKREARAGLPVVLHAASDPKFKGTEAVRAAVERTAERVPLDFRLLVGVPHHEVDRALGRADVVIDQLDSVTSGVFALEAMCYGIPVLGEIDRKALPPYQADLPLVAVTAATLEHELEALLRDPDRRARIGAAGPAYVERTHDPRLVAETALRIYRHVRRSDPGVYEATSAGIRPLELTLG